MAEERVQRRLAAILVVDVVGYSGMMKADEAGKLAALKTLRRDFFVAKTKQYGGRIFKTTGDGALVEFTSAVDAVNSAIDDDNLHPSGKVHTPWADTIVPPAESALLKEETS